jgi:ABC-2 type transport system ATP-binding protein
VSGQGIGRQFVSSSISLCQSGGKPPQLHLELGLLKPCGCARGWRRHEACVAPTAVKSRPSVLQQPDRLPVPFGESITLQTAMRPVIQVSGVRKSYGATVAVHEVSFEVNEGEIFGLIGPNGAGKTTTMECIEGLRTPDRGSIAVLGLDPFKDVYKLQDRIGVQLQQAQLQKRIKVWEAVDLWVSLYRKKASDGERLLEQLGLADKRDAWFMNLSGGQKQRLFIALALINDPEVVFLDELTTGLDPQARRAIWDLVRDIRERGKTVFLTTHLMEEAERLCDRVAVIEHGRIIDIDRPENLVNRHCPERTVVLATENPIAEERFRAIAGVETVMRTDSRFTIRGCGDDLVTEVIHCLSENGIRVTDFRTIMPNLEDVFLKLTGHSIRE